MDHIIVSALVVERMLTRWGPSTEVWINIGQLESSIGDELARDKGDLYHLNFNSLTSSFSAPKYVLFCETAAAKEVRRVINLVHQAVRGVSPEMNKQRTCSEEGARLGANPVSWAEASLGSFRTEMNRWKRTNY